jgi:hypothetical protein
MGSMSLSTTPSVVAGTAGSTPADLSSVRSVKASAVSSTAAGTSSTSSIASTAICTVAKNSAAWASASVGQAFETFASTGGPFPSGIVAGLVQAIPGVQGSDFACGSQSTCSFGNYRQVCPDDPTLATTLLGIVNFANFFQRIIGVASDAAEGVIGQGASIVSRIRPPSIVNGADSNHSHRQRTSGLKSRKKSLPLQLRMLVSV